MNNEEKILGMLEKLTEKVDGMGQRIDQMDQRMDRMEGCMDRMEGRMDRMEGCMGQMEGRMDRMEGRMDQMEGRMDRMETDISGIKVRLDVDVQKQINLLSEANSRIVERLDALEEVRELAEETRDKVDVIYAVVKMHSGDIAELKKAQ